MSSWMINYRDKPISGRFLPDGNFLLIGSFTCKKEKTCFSSCLFQTKRQFYIIGQRRFQIRISLFVHIIVEYIDERVHVIVVRTVYTSGIEGRQGIPCSEAYILKLPRETNACNVGRFLFTFVFSTLNPICVDSLSENGFQAVNKQHLYSHYKENCRLS